MKKGNGSFHVRKYLNPPERLKDRCIIHVEDIKSGIRFLELELSKGDFIDAIAGGNVNCTFLLRSEFIGFKRENKTKLIRTEKTDYNSLNTKEKRKKFLVPYEKNGWEGYGDDLINSSRAVLKKEKLFQRVSFFRYVKPKKKKRKVK